MMFSEAVQCQHMPFYICLCPAAASGNDGSRWGRFSADPADDPGRTSMHPEELRRLLQSFLHTLCLYLSACTVWPCSVLLEARTGCILQ